MWWNGGGDWRGDTHGASPVTESWPGGGLGVPPHWRAGCVQWGEPHSHAVGSAPRVAQWCTVCIQLLLPLGHTGDQGRQHYRSFPLQWRRGNSGRSTVDGGVWAGDTLPHLGITDGPPQSHIDLVCVWRWGGSNLCRNTLSPWWIDGARDPTRLLLRADQDRLGSVSPERTACRGLILEVQASYRDREPLPWGHCRGGGRADTVAGGEY